MGVTLAPVHPYAALYHFLARVYLRPPDAELLGLAADIADLEPHLTDDLKHRHSELFEFNVYPYASIFLDPSGMLNAPWSGFVTGVFEALGLETVLGAGLAAPDHIGAQLEALAALLEREETVANSPKAGARHAQQILLTEHLLPWLPCFVAAVKRADAGFYAEVARLTLELVLEHTQQLLDSPPAPFAFPEAEGDISYQSPAGKKGSGEARQRLQDLITPARSGMFLSREDVRQLGRELGLPTRFAERSFMLETVVQGAADAEVLAALFAAFVQLAQQQKRVYKILETEYPLLNGFWKMWTDKLEFTAEYYSDLGRNESA